MGEGDNGPNTGGMGAYSPPTIMTAELSKRIMREIVEPTLRGMNEKRLAVSRSTICGFDGQ